MVETRVRPHPVVRREGLDLVLDLPVTVAEAYRGAQVEVPTFDGSIRLRVPPRSQPGARLRVRGKGVERGDRRGDLFVVLDVKLPDRPDDEVAEALGRAESAYSRPVREGMRL